MLKHSPRGLLIALFLLIPIQSLQADQSISVVSQNLNRFFDDQDNGLKEKILSPQAYQKRINQLTEKILTQFSSPDVVALQEVENQDILDAVVNRLNKKGINYRSILIEGNDVSGIDVGFLIKNSLQITEQKQLFKQVLLGNTDSFLFSRPPLLIQVCATECVTIVNIHLRSMRDLRNNKEGKRVALKRKQQSEWLAKWVNQYQNSYPSRRLLLVGDFNALPDSDKYVDVVGTIRGQPDQKHPRWKSKDLVKKDLIDLTRTIPASQRYSFIYKKHRQQLDYFLMSDNPNYKVKSLRFSDIDYKFSDHAALIGEIVLLQ